MYNHISFIRWIKKHIPFWLRIALIRLYVVFEKVMYIFFRIGEKDFGSRDKVFVLLSTDYSNLGDHAMTYAQIKYLERCFPDHEIIEISVGDTLRSLRSIKRSLNSRDIVTLKGGGNVGVQYFREELIRREIARYLDDVKIVMFPQTVYFPDTRFGHREFINSMKFYDSNDNFFFFARDEISYKTVAPYIRNAFLVPDIVFSLGELEYTNNGGCYALTCIRDDVEGIYSVQEKEMVFDLLRGRYPDLVSTDTIREYKIERKDREKELLEIWSMIGSASVVVTDRLHGMIFAALAGTPCIVLNTYNHKLRGQYEWIEDLDYIVSCDLGKDEVILALDQLALTNAEWTQNDRFCELFKPLRNVLLNNLS